MNRELRDSLNIIVIFGIVIFFVFLSSYFPLTPLAPNNWYGFSKNKDDFQIMSEYITIDFNDELQLYTASTMFPINNYQSYIITRDLHTIPDLQDVIAEGFHIANFSVISFSYTIETKVNGFGVLTQNHQVNAYINGELVRKTLLEGTTSKFISLRYGENELTFDGHELNITFFMYTGLFGISANALVEVKGISIMLKITLTNAANDNETQSDINNELQDETQPQEDSDITQVPLATPSYTGNPSREILPYSWIVFGIPISKLSLAMAIVLGVLLWLLIRKLKKIRH